MSDISIEEFYEKNICNKFFDEKNYVYKYPSVIGFYEEHCKHNGISDKKRFYFHWHLYGLSMGHEPCKDNIYHTYAFIMEEINKSKTILDNEKGMLLTVFFNLTKNNLYDPHVCQSKEDKKKNIKILKYMTHCINLSCSRKTIYFHD